MKVATLFTVTVLIVAGVAQQQTSNAVLGSNDSKQGSERSESASEVLGQRRASHGDHTSTSIEDRKGGNNIVAIIDLFGKFVDLVTRAKASGKCHADPKEGIWPEPGVTLHKWKPGKRFVVFVRCTTSCSPDQVQATKTHFKMAWDRLSSGILKAKPGADLPVLSIVDADNGGDVIILYVGYSEPNQGNRVGNYGKTVTRSEFSPQLGRSRFVTDISAWFDWAEEGGTRHVFTRELIRFLKYRAMPVNSCAGSTPDSLKPNSEDFLVRSETTYAVSVPTTNDFLFLGRYLSMRCGLFFCEHATCGISYSGVNHKIVCH